MHVGMPVATGAVYTPRLNLSADMFGAAVSANEKRRSLSRNNCHLAVRTSETSGGLSISESLRSGQPGSCPAGATGLRCRGPSSSGGSDCGADG
eukprot:4400253-Pyramimonas_sp.AAC.1